MGANTRVKICGLRDVPMMQAAVDAGANDVGLVFFPKSPRNVTLEQAAIVAAEVPVGIAKVALVVNPDDAQLDALGDRVPLDILQLHGAETPERVAEVKTRFGLPVMKAIGIATQSDLPQIDAHGAVADLLLLDAKPPKGADRPGGNAVAFDWSLLAGKDIAVPWLLAGGLGPINVTDAIQQTGAVQVDVSSGVERAPGMKDPGLMHAFIKAARAA